VAGERSHISRKTQRANQLVAITCFGVFFGMIGLAYAAVPIYRAFCAATGYGGTTKQASAAPSEVLAREIDVVFDANTRNGLPWDFHPVQRSITMKIGETREIHYTARNNSNAVTRGRTTFNVEPEWAGAYFNKIQCFCFTDLTLKPGESEDLPVVFFVDPAIVKAEEAKGLHSITLSYSMFPVDETKTSSIAKRAVPIAGGAQETTNSSVTNIGG
jgi:cytochrome c oxidase assembly protein subunit 11